LLASAGNWPKLAYHDKHNLNDRRDAPHFCNKNMSNDDSSIDNSRIVAAVDLGSNSFHMIVARLDESGTISVIDKLRETVRLGGGLKDNGNLSKSSM